MQRMFRRTESSAKKRVYIVFDERRISVGGVEFLVELVQDMYSQRRCTLLRFIPYDRRILDMVETRHYNTQPYMDKHILNLGDIQLEIVVKYDDQRILDVRARVVKTSR